MKISFPKSAAVAAVVGLTLATSTVAQAATPLPANIKKAGFITIGVDSTYSPNEFKDAAGKPTGWEVELFAAVAAQLGVKAKFVIATFDTILPAVKAGKYDLGVSSFTDNKEREASVDFVDYFSAGTSWATRKGVTLDPNAACGKIVTAQTGSTQADDLKAKSADCTKAGKKAITILTYDSQEQATSAVVLGRADATAADSPVLAYAVLQSKGKLAVAGKTYGQAPYGTPIAKGSTLTKSISEALTALQANGTYNKILTKWGVQSGAVKSFGINGAIN